MQPSSSSVVTCSLLGLVLLAGCPSDEVMHLDDAPVPVDAPIDAPTCTAPTGAGTMHGGTINTETWTAAASPHILPFDAGVYGVLTIEPCAVVRIAGAATVTVRVGGKFLAAGAPGLPVTIERQAPAAAWASIRALGGDISLVHTIVRGGGAPLATTTNLAAAVQIQTGTLHMEDVEIADSASQGVYLAGSVGFDATSKNVRIHGSASAPIHTYARVIGSIPTGTYTGNTLDEIMISNTGNVIVDDQTMHNRGVPYHVGIHQGAGQLDVGTTAGGISVLTIEPGVTLEFETSGLLRISPTSGGTTAAVGALIAVGGTAPADKITFTSDAATPAAGAWFGVWFFGANDARTKMQNAVVRYAGGASVTGSNSCPYVGRIGQNDAAIRVFGTTAPGTAFVTDTQILDSARDGIDRGWRDDPQPDFLPTNTFTNVAGCKQTVPRTFNGVCPATPACP